MPAERLPQADWLTWIKRIHGLAGSGLHYGAEEFDRERYAEIARLAEQMLAQLADAPLEHIRQQFPTLGESYATPLVDVRGAVFQDNAILLVQERSDGCWALPGGYADIGLSAGENVVKEVWEETALRVAVSRVISVHHKAKHAYEHDARDFYKLFFFCESIDGQTLEPQPGHEVSAARFFRRDELPQLSHQRVILEDLERAWSFAHNQNLPPYFD